MDADVHQTMTAKTPAQRKAAQRAREKAAELAEVRGILAPPLRHPEIKEAAAKVLRRKPRKQLKDGTKPD
jgi:hypothetical protein